MFVFMSDTPDPSSRKQWLRRASSIRRSIHLGWWVDAMAAPFVLLGLVGCAALLLCRRLRPDIPPQALLWGTAAGVTLVFLAACLVARRKFEKPATTLLRLEAAGNLNGRLSAAIAGVAAWPDAALIPQRVLTWRWPRLLTAPLGALALLAAGLWMPLPETSQAAVIPAEEPLAWKKLEQELDQLAEEKLVEQPYIENTRKQIEELRAREEEEWFSQSSLEATASLEKAHRSAMQQLAGNMEQADAAAGTWRESLGQGNEAESAKLSRELGEALQQLNALPAGPDPQLVADMAGLTPEQFSNLSPEQMDQLRESLQRNAQRLREMRQGAEGEGEGEGEGEALAGGKCPGDGPCAEGCTGACGANGGMPGKGGISRGPGHVPQVLGDKSDEFETGDIEGVKGDEIKDSLPGDVVGLGVGKHEIEEKPTTIGAGGSAAAAGSGGDRIWRDSLAPDEQRAVRSFFE